MNDRVVVKINAKTPRSRCFLSASRCSSNPAGFWIVFAKVSGSGSSSGSSAKKLLMFSNKPSSQEYILRISQRTNLNGEVIILQKRRKALRISQLCSDKDSGRSIDWSPASDSVGAEATGSSSDAVALVSGS